MPIFCVRLHSFLAHKLLAPPPSGTVAPPQNLRALLYSPSERIFLSVQRSPGCPANSAHRKDEREVGQYAEQ